ncbi:GGDEF domain-containing protein [Pseudomonas sp. W2Oct36]|uniref:GGDEF domain-containing protein n=1 Tax=Pseudomonas sp. W2Oct36 TaxID=1215284 RepID=UPI0034E08F0D
MAVSERYFFPRTTFIAWFVRGNDQLDAATRLKLLAGPFSSGMTLIAAGFSTLLICSVALYRHPIKIFMIWLCVDTIIWNVRLLLFRRCNAPTKPPLKYATDLSLLLGLVWAAEIGAGTAACIISGDPVLQVLSSTLAVSLNGAIAMRNQGIPHYAFAQILLTDIPLKFSTLFQSEPMLMILILQAPMYLGGLWILLKHFNSNLAKAYHAEAHSSYLANHDSLTGLLNRAGIFSMLRGLLKPSSQNPEHLALLYFDLDGFKSINDSYGHAAGDKALTMFSTLLNSNIRTNDFAARLGGDEFIVVLRTDLEEHATLITERIIKSIGEYRRTYDAFHGLGVSVGISLSDSAGTDTPETLLHRADIALYQANWRVRDVIGMRSDDYLTLLPSCSA